MLTKLAKRKDKEGVPSGIVEVNPNVVDVLEPSVFADDDPSGETCQVWSGARTIGYMHDYESMMDINWGSPLYNRQGAITTIMCRPSDGSSLRKKIDHSQARQGMTIAEGSSASKEEEAQRRRDHGNTMLRIMGDANESFYETAIFETLNASDRESVRKQEKNLASVSAGKGVTYQNCARRQQAAYLSAGPWWVDDDIVWQRYARDMAVSTICASLPFQDNSLDDAVGTTLGYCEPDHSMCRVNMAETNPARVNCNAWISGQSGQGKTYGAGKILLSEWAQGARVMVIDPERQFRKFCRNASGQWINAGGGVRKDKDGRLKGACFSPLQPRIGNFSLEDDEDDVSSTEDAYASDTQEVLRATLTFFHGWAELAWSTDADDTPLLDHGLIAAYKRYGIDFETTAGDLVADRYPTFDDVKECFEELCSKCSDVERARSYQRFADKAEQCCENGIYGNLWAYRTNVDITSDMVVFDTYELMESESHIRTAQLFSILSWVWSQACVSRFTKQFLRVFIDEVHLIFNTGDDKVSTTAAAYVNMVQKRIRKYHGGLMVATQQIGDVLADEVRRYGESLLTSSTYKMFFATESTDLKALVEVMDFTHNVETMLRSDFRRGDCLLQAGSSRARVHIEALRFEEEFFDLTDRKQAV